MSSRSNGWVTAAAFLATVGCAGPQHALDPRGPAAARIADLWWVMLALGTAVSAIVTVLLLVAVQRARRRQEGRAVREVSGRALVWGGGVIVPVLILLPLLAYSHQTGTDVYPPLDDPDALTVEVVGHQFWWEVRYPAHGIVTANEIHIPVGQPVRFRVTAPDVIHSFWIPQLQGKIDMIPGRIHTLWIEAETPGEFRGQCSEFCGMAHALMALWVVALPGDEFAGWLEERAAAVPEPEDPEVEEGRSIFFGAGCGTCHPTRGAELPEVLGTPGPDLSSVATRRTLAAGTLPNTREALAAWIDDPQSIKPGSRMPGTELTAAEMQALLTYLESLR